MGHGEELKTVEEKMEEKNAPFLSPCLARLPRPQKGSDCYAGYSPQFPSFGPREIGSKIMCDGKLSRSNQNIPNL